MLKKFFKFAGVLASVPFLASIAPAQQVRVYRDGGSWTEEVAGSLSAAKNLRVRVDFGSVRVQGGTQQDITYVIRTRSYSSDEKQARREFEAYKISASTRGDAAWIEGDWQGGHHHLCSGEFVINVPRDLNLAKLETSGGGVTVGGITGRVEAESGGGKIHLDDIGGSVSAETGGDSIEIGTVNGDLRLETGGGKIYIASAKGKVEASTGGGNIVLVSGAQEANLEAGGGNIDVKHCGGRLRVSTGGGNIELGDISGPVEIETGGGSIRLGWAKGVVRAQTGAGRIELNGVSSARAETGAGGILAKFISSSGERSDSLLETSAGDIVVYIAPDVAITVRASIDLANGHKILSDFTDIRVTSEGGEWPGPKSFTAEGKLNGGGPTLKVRTTTGDIRFLRASR
ncbi:MAG TPA: hypothetical protein VE083_04865 [Terriglobales bacterium]|nr:hypothetical protein [Terriglobales bacterium]